MNNKRFCRSCDAELDVDREDELCEDCEEHESGIEQVLEND